MKKGGSRSVSSRSSSEEPRESWRKWVLSLLALGFALLVITMLSQQNEALNNTLAQMRAAATGESAQDEYPLSFDLPEGWIMTEGCTMMIDGERQNGDCGNNIASIKTAADLPVLDRVVSPDATVVYLQNTDRLPLFGGIAPNEAVADAYQSSDVTVITVQKVASQDVLTNSNGRVTDMGEGFYKVNICDVNIEGPECGIYGQGTDIYYFFGETGIYVMSYSSTVMGGPALIEGIIFSAQE